MRIFATEVEVQDDGTHNHYIRIELSSERDFNALKSIIDNYWFSKKDPEDCKCVLGNSPIEKISKEFNKLNKLVEELPVERNYDAQTKWCSNFHRTMGRLEKAIEEAKEK